MAKLKLVNTTCKFSGTAAFLAMLAACTGQPPTAPLAPSTIVVPQHLQAPAEARAYDIDPLESLLTVQVFRGGALAKAGHNHVVASHDLTGTIQVAAAALQSTFEIHVPVGQFTVDEPTLREALHREDFPPQVPESARTGTRHNMLGPAVLDADHHPQIVLRSAGLQATQDGAVQADVVATVRGEDHLIHATLRYHLTDGALDVLGQFPLKQSELGLTPFSALMGALAVQDQMQVSFQLHAHARVQDER